MVLYADTYGEPMKVHYYPMDTESARGVFCQTCSNLDHLPTFHPRLNGQTTECLREIRTDVAQPALVQLPPDHCYGKYSKPAKPGKDGTRYLFGCPYLDCPVEPFSNKTLLKKHYNACAQRFGNLTNFNIDKYTEFIQATTRRKVFTEALWRLAMESARTEEAGEQEQEQQQQQQQEEKEEEKQEEEAEKE